MSCTFIIVHDDAWDIHFIYDVWVFLDSAMPITVTYLVFLDSTSLLLTAAALELGSQFESVLLCAAGVPPKESITISEIA